MAKSWRELLSDEDAISMIREWVSASPLEVAVIPAETDDGCRTLEALQVTTRSPLGAMALHTGGILVDHGWLRVLGAGSARLPRALDRWNTVDGVPRCDKGILIADDVLGGFFAWFREPRTVHYLAPDTLEWEDSELGYTDWLRWCFTDGLLQYYADYRWDGWAADVTPIGGAAGILVYPPLFAKGPPIKERYRGAVPVAELWSLGLDFAKQLRELPEGAEFEMEVKP